MNDDATFVDLDQSAVLYHALARLSHGNDRCVSIRGNEASSIIEHNSPFYSEVSTILEIAVQKCVVNCTLQLETCLFACY